MSNASSASNPHRLGAAGEAAAAQWYESQGWTILARNWRSGRGELDLIAARGEVLAICEVKTRSNASYAWPADAVNWKKQSQIRKLAYRWLQQSPRYYPQVRFDVAEVLVARGGGFEINVYENAF